MSGTNGNGKRNGKRPGPAPWTPTPEQVEQIGKLAATLTQAQIADFLGISERTLRNRMWDTPEIRAAYEKGKAAAIDGVAKNLIEQAKAGNVTAGIFYLKTQAGWRETQRVEHTGADGEAIEIAAVAAEARRNLVGRLAGIAERVTANRLAQKP